MLELLVGLFGVFFRVEEVTSFAVGVFCVLVIGCTVKIAETKLAQIKNGRRIAIFNGLLIVVDICGVKVKRGHAAANPA